LCMREERQCAREEEYEEDSFHIFGDCIGKKLYSVCS
jgi:hypothetical protein